MELQKIIDKYIDDHRKVSYTEADMRLMGLFVGGKVKQQNKKPIWKSLIKWHPQNKRLRN